MSNKEICVELIRLLYTVEPAGGLLHIVLDDDNVSDSSLAFCAGQIQEMQGRALDEGRIHIFIEMAILSYLCYWTEEERQRVINAALRGAEKGMRYNERQAALPWVTVPDKDDDELIRKLDMPAIVLAGGQYRVMDYDGEGYWTDEYGYLDRVESPYMVLPVSAIQP